MKQLIDSFDRQFSALYLRSKDFVELIPNEKLFWKPREINRSMTMFSCGEYVLRSAGKIEQTFGGITTRLWDDPFEWTLPEELSTTNLILDYLEEVEKTRRRGFALFDSDEDLRREMPAPEKLKSIFNILLETVSVAEHYQGRAFAIFQMFSDEKLPLI
jgi:hypothetical protein